MPVSSNDFDCIYVCVMALPNIVLMEYEHQVHLANDLELVSSNPAMDADTGMCLTLDRHYRND